MSGRERSGVYSPQAEAIHHKLGLAAAPEEIQSQLQRIVSSRVFAASARMSRFLRFTVEETIAGRAEDLKEITIGLAVFDRAHDPRIDPIVRVEACRLREKLAQYYDADGKEDSIIIELPRGGYAPVFRQRAESAVPLLPGSRRRHQILLKRQQRKRLPRLRALCENSWLSRSSLRSRC
jgi:hypothetical protein